MRLFMVKNKVMHMFHNFSKQSKHLDIGRTWVEVFTKTKNAKGDGNKATL